MKETATAHTVQLRVDVLKRRHTDADFFTCSTISDEANFSPTGTIHRQNCITERTRICNGRGGLPQIFRKIIIWADRIKNRILRYYQVRLSRIETI